MGGGKLRGLMTKLRRDVRALSPIFAVLLLIAIAVIAGIIIYMYTAGYLGTMMGGGTTGQEKVAIEAVKVAATGDVTVYAINTGGGPDVVIVSVILRDASGIAVEQVAPTAGATLTLGVLSSVTCKFTAANLTPGNTYTVALVSKAGGQFVSGSFLAP